MEEVSRRSFVLAALAFVAGGCAKGFYLGGGGHVIGRPPEKAEEGPEKNANPLHLSRKDPVYTGDPDDGWMPDLDPVPRALWAPAAPIRGRLQSIGRVSRITVHHEGSGTAATHLGFDEVAADLQDIRRVHLRDMNAGDIGYHYVIDRAGRIWEGRPARYRGAHAGGEANRENLGIMLLGNFDIQRPAKRQLKALRLFLLKTMNGFRVPVRRVFTHRELKPTRCPGEHLQRYMVRLRAQL